MDARPLRTFDRGSRPLDVLAPGPGQGRDHRPPYLPRYPPDRLEIALGRNGETCFEDVDSQSIERMRHPELFRFRHAAARRLLAVAQCRIKEENIVVYHVGTSAEPGLSVPLRNE